MKSLMMFLVLISASMAHASGGEPANLECSWGGQYYFDMPFKYGTTSPRTIDGDVSIYVRNDLSGTVQGTVSVTGQRYVDGLAISGGKKGKANLSLHMSGAFPVRTTADANLVYHGTMHLTVPGSTVEQGNDIPVRCNFTKAQE